MCLYSQGIVTILMAAMGQESGIPDSLAQDDMTLDTVRESFRWGLILVFAAVLIDSLSSAEIVN